MYLIRVLFRAPFRYFRVVDLLPFFGAGPGRNLHLEVERIDLVVCPGATKK